MPYALAACAICGGRAPRPNQLVCDLCLDEFGLREKPVSEWPAWAKSLREDWRRERRRDIRNARRIVPYVDEVIDGDED